ncbi:N-acetyltransferase [Salinibacterium amurskyense]|nr:N-acetyltransferase [Salinibacterium amurskyense]
MRTPPMRSSPASRGRSSEHHMQPVVLTTERLTLDALTEADVDVMTSYCQDTVLKDAVPIPWPYEREHADGFINELAPQWWAEGSELTWAIRRTGNPLLLGVVGFNVKSAAIGYWLGTPHRGNGFMPEAVTAAVNLLHSMGHAELHWEAVVGNVASARVAEKVGFDYTGTAPALGRFRDDTRPLCWHAHRAADNGELAKPTDAALPWPHSFETDVH